MVNYVDLSAGDSPTLDDDNVVGTNGADVVGALSGDDTVNGGGGNDSIYGGEGSDSLNGNNGDDVLNGGDGGDILNGNSGNDVLNGEAGDDDLFGSGGSDVLNGGDGQDTLNGGADNDTLSGGEDNDVLYGRTGDDSLSGNHGDDKLFGEDGDDFLEGGNGKDTLKGGDGNDILAGDAHDDELQGGDGNDTLFGVTGNDLLFGQTGADSLMGGDGNDTLVGGAGVDYLDGGSGNDIVDYSQDGGSFGVNVNLSLNTATDTHGNAETIVNIEGVIGTAQNDTLTGSVGYDTFVGGDGVDSFDGGMSSDPEDNNGHGFDVVNFQQESGGGGVVVSLNSYDLDIDGTIYSAHSATDTFGNSGESITGIEVVHGTSGNDTLIGSDQDILETFYTYGGSNYLNGGDGHTRYFIRGALDGTKIEVGASLLGARDVINIGFGDPLVLTTGNITIVGEPTSGSSFQHHLIFDNLYTSDQTGVFINLSGNDLGFEVSVAYGATWTGGSLDFSEARFFLEVEGSRFDDTIIGGAYEHLEWYTGNAGADTIHGGTPTNDTIVYENENSFGASGGVTVRLDGTGTLSLRDGSVVTPTLASIAQLEDDYGFTVTQRGYALDRFGHIDTLINIEDIRATSDDDYLVGSDEDNSFWGLNGDDYIDGGVGRDAVHYRADIFNEVGDPAIPVSGIHVNLSSGVVSSDGYGGEDTLVSIEEIYGNDIAGGDSIIGDGADNLFLGYGGNDTLEGAGGDDTLEGGEGADSLDGGDGFDTAQFEQSSQAITVLLSGGGAVSYARFGDLSDIARDTSSDDELQNIEHLSGTGYDDTLTGNANHNHLNGRDGNDSLSGGAGNDTLLGNNNDDNLDGGADNDVLDGGTGDDTLTGGNGDDSLIGGDGLDSLNGGYGGDTLQGGNDNDELDGGGNHDVLDGGNGADRLTGGVGADTLTGGSGADTFIFSNAFGQDTITDFDVIAVDEIIDLSEVSAISDFADLTGNHMVQVNSDVVIDDLLGNTITLTGLTLTNLTAAEFAFG